MPATLKPAGFRRWPALMRLSKPYARIAESRQRLCAFALSRFFSNKNRLFHFSEDAH